MLNQNQYFITILFILAIASCQRIDPETNNTEKHLFISHTLDRDANILQERIKSIPFKNYKSLILGGDLLLDSSKGKETLDELDNAFDLSSNSTLWSLGNHDYTDRDLISEYTQRPSFYTTTIGALSFIILDTQLNKSKIIDSQLDMFLSATAKRKDITHFIIISHHLIWLDDQGELMDQIDFISNAPIGDCQYCLHSNNFYSDLYPALVNIKKEGIEVICIAGDIGDKVDKFEYLTDEGIQFLASGFDPKSQNNKALVLQHIPENKILTWKYKDVDEL